MKQGMSHIVAKLNLSSCSGASKTLKEGPSVSVFFMLGINIAILRHRNKMQLLLFILL